MWAGLHLQADDLPGTSAGSYYPLPLIRADDGHGILPGGGHITARWWT